MLHSVKIYDRGQCIQSSYGTDIGKLTFSISVKLLGMDISYLQIYVDNEHFGVPSCDVVMIRKDMTKRMEFNEKPINFDIEHLFEV